MHRFLYKNNNLYCETLKIENIAHKVETPFYLYSYATLLDHYRKIKRAFAPVKPLICFSMKSNSNLTVCRALVKEGAGLDIVSGGELYKALKIGAKPEKIVYASVGKTAMEIDTAIKKGILFFNVESASELVMIENLCKRLNRRTKISLRINPGIRPRTHRFITTGISESKFGLDFSTAGEIFAKRNAFPHLDIIGLHMHIGSQITNKAPFVNALRKIAPFIKKLRDKGISINYINIGGGMGIIYSKERPQTAKEYARAILPILKKLKVKVILEPGRFISGNSGVLITRVLYVKKTPRRRFIIADAGMNDLIRPALYDAYHEILPLRRLGKVETFIKTDVVGPICESADYLAKNRRLPNVEEGDLLAIMGAGAYGFSMSSNYNARPRVAEVMVIKGRYYIVRRRETYQDLIRGEFIPRILGTSSKVPPFSTKKI